MGIHETYRNASEALPDLLDRVLSGDTVPSRNGNTAETLMNQITLEQPFPFEITTPGRNVSLPAQIAETMWLLAGRDDVEWLSHYLPRAKDFSDDGKTWRGAYGPRLRNFGNTSGEQDGTDQLAHVVQLLQNDPESRRAVMAIYDPYLDSAPGKDIPCNNWVHFMVRDNRLQAHVVIRSNDLMWGWSGINSFAWAAVQHIVAAMLGLHQGSLTFSISSLHLYENHWDRAARLSKLAREIDWPSINTDNPAFSHRYNIVPALDALVRKWFEMEQAIRENDQYVVLDISMFPEPMLRSWLYVLHSWHTGRALPMHLLGTSLHAALKSSPRRKEQVPELQSGTMEAQLAELHTGKHAAYGDSWMRRGEMLGIMANVARKVDRLGVDGGGDTSTDTALDLLAYAIKHRLWLVVHAGAPMPFGMEHPGNTAGMLTSDLHLVLFNAVLAHLQQQTGGNRPDLTGIVRQTNQVFDKLEQLVTDRDPDRYVLVDKLVRLAHRMSEDLVAQEQAGHDEWRAGNATRSWNPEA